MPSVTVRLRVRARARECIFPFFYFFAVKSDKHLCLMRVSGNCNVRGIKGECAGLGIVYVWISRCEMI